MTRALTLLVLLRAQYAPLVADNRQRGAYLDALDRANDGDLRELIRLFARLEIVALRSELEMPAGPATGGAGALAVARAYAHRLRALQHAKLTERATKAELLADELHPKMTTHLTELGAGVCDQFREADFFTNLSKGSWWTRLQLIVLNQTLRFVVSIQRVGHGESGVLAVTAFAEVLAS